MENFLSENSIYIVLLIALILWLGIASYLYVLDSKLIKLEKQIKNINNEGNNEA